MEMRQVLSWRRGDAVFMAEANLPRDQVSMYFGEGNRVHVIFNFYVNQHLWLALAREQAQPIRDAYPALPQIPSTAIGRIFCVRTMSWTLAASAIMSDKKCSRSSVPRRACSCTTAASGDGRLRCWETTGGGWNWRIA